MTSFKPNLLALAILSAGISSQSQAGEAIDLGNDLTLDWKGTATYTAAARTEGRADPAFTDSSGNRNFDDGDLVSNRLALLMEGRLYKGDTGLVMSASTFYDDAYQDDDKFSADAEKFHGGYTRLLDLYGYSTFDLGDDRLLNLRLGKHVVAWGEALFMPSISLAQGPSDATKAGIPGTEVKDILLPEDQISMQLEMNPNWSLMAHAQYNWHPVMVPEPGTYLSTSEAVGEGATCLTAAPGEPCFFGNRSGDIEPDKTGQWGIGTRIRTSLDTELGFYYLNYHDRIPLPEVSAMTNSYRVRYFDDIELYGASFTTMMGIASVAGEISYKKGAPVLLNTPIVPATPTRADILQTNLNTIVNFGRTPLADVVTLVAEVAYVDILDVEERGTPGFAGTETDDLYYTSHGLAFSSKLTLSYPGVTDNWDLSVPISYARQLSGRTITGGVGGEGDHRFGIGADFTHKNGVQVGLNYLSYLGGDDWDEPFEERKLTDRDNISLTVKYAF